MLHCALLVANGPLEPSSPDYEECTSVSALPSDTPTALRKNWPQFFTAYYLADKVSLMSSVYTHRYDSVDHQRLGAMPLVVLSAPTRRDPTSVVPEWRLPNRPNTVTPGVLIQRLQLRGWARIFCDPRPDQPGAGCPQ